MGGSQPLFFMKKIRIFVFGRDNVYIVLTWDFYGNDWIIFPEIIPPQPPWKWEIFPSLEGCPQGGGFYSAKKMNIFLFCYKKSATFAI